MYNACVNKRTTIIVCEINTLRKTRFRIRIRVAAHVDSTKNPHSSQWQLLIAPVKLVSDCATGEFQIPFTARCFAYFIG